MKTKRILSVLLAVAMLLTMDGINLYAMETPEDDKQNTQETQEETGQYTQETEQEQETRDVWLYTVDFDLNGGITVEGEDNFSLRVPEGGLVNAGEVVEVTKRGYLFQGWQDREGKYYGFDRPVTEDITLFAAWTPITYRVKFDLNGGEGNVPSEKVLSYDEQLLLPVSECYREDFVLVGWEQENVGIYQEGTAVEKLTDEEDAVVVLKAVWRRGEYKIRFDANGGAGEMEDQVFSCGNSKKLKKNKYKREGYQFAGWNIRDDGKGKQYKQQESVAFPDRRDGDVVVLYAMWKGNSYQVKYNGNGATSGKVSNTKHVYGTKSKLGKNRFKRRGYTFAGWNTKKNGKGKNYKASAGVTGLTKEKGGVVTLYAKWKLTTYKIIYHTRKGNLSGKAKKTYHMLSKTFSLPIPSRKGYDFDGWYKDAKYKKRVSRVEKGSVGDKEFYAKWVKCDRKPSESCGKITTCEATNSGKVKIKATIKKRAASPDGLYYLVYVNPYSTNPYKQVAETYKKDKVSFTLNIAENRGYVTAMFGIAVKKNGKYYLVSDRAYVKNPEKAAKNKSSYKPGKTKKGIQFDKDIKEIKASNSKNTFLNLTASYICSNAAVPYEYNGKTYYFSSMDSFKNIVSECNKKGINVTMQILLDWVDGQEDLIDSRARVRGAAPFYTWNVRENGGREKMEAMFCYVGSVFGRKKCYVSNWILGNEVNNPRGWNYAGETSADAYFKVYAYAFRSLYYAIRSQYSNAHIFICMDNFWNTYVQGGCSAKFSIAMFDMHLKKIQKGLEWHLAYHAYSSPLTYTNFWDGYGITYDENSPYITMKNLDVLTRYIKKNYGSSVRIILSEQGYASNWGQTNQAAAIAASYYIAACNPTIDAFIIRSYYDHPVEVAQGLPMGIYGKEAYNIFKYMDTSKTLDYTNRYLGVINISSWNQLVPGYNKKRLYKMYRK